MGKNHLGMRRSGGASSASRVKGLAAGRAGGLASDLHLRRPYLPETPQQANFDNDGPRLQGLEKNLSGGNH
jgi:hypothetical protein